eukprot:scaffold10793_cov96-Phaeocystis_antarctica.AAC.2
MVLSAMGLRLWSRRRARGRMKRRFCPEFIAIGRIFEDDRCLTGRETGGDGQVDGSVQESIGSS